MYTKHKKRSSGFTIVELLIVVVVIAILAAITIVAYNGIQNRAYTTAAQADNANAMKRVEIHNVETAAFPTSITDCPTPASSNICLTQPSGTTFRYTANNTADPKTYEIASMNPRQFSYRSTAEKTGVNEFLQFTDLAPYIDKYGLVPYRLTFDIKSANISASSLITVYMQNGSTAKYGFSIAVPVTTSFTSHTLVFTPTLVNGSVPQSMLAFWGHGYGNGNIATVKNVRFQLD